VVAQAVPGLLVDNRASVPAKQDPPSAITLATRVAKEAATMWKHEEPPIKNFLRRIYEADFNSYRKKKAKVNGSRKRARKRTNKVGTVTYFCTFK
jgi:hypothetical protein